MGYGLIFAAFQRVNPMNTPTIQNINLRKITQWEY